MPNILASKLKQMHKICDTGSSVFVVQDSRLYSGIGSYAFEELLEFYHSEASETYGVRPPNKSKSLNIFAKTLGYPHWKSLQMHYSNDFVSEMPMSYYLELLVDTFDSSTKGNVAHPFHYLTSNGWKRSRQSLMSFEKTFVGALGKKSEIKIDFHNGVNVHYESSRGFSGLSVAHQGRTVSGFSSEVHYQISMLDMLGVSLCEPLLIAAEIGKVFDASSLHALNAYFKLGVFSEQNGHDTIPSYDQGVLHQPAVLCRYMVEYHKALKSELSIKGLSSTKVANVLSAFIPASKSELLSKNAPKSEEIVVEIPTEKGAIEAVLSISSEGLLYRKLTVSAYLCEGGKRVHCLCTQGKIELSNGPMIGYYELYRMVEGVLSKAIVMDKDDGKISSYGSCHSDVFKMLTHLCNKQEGKDMNSYFYRPVLSDDTPVTLDKGYFPEIDFTNMGEGEVLKSAFGDDSNVIAFPKKD
jgi:hypothetical protein